MKEVKSFNKIVAMAGFLLSSFCLGSSAAQAQSTSAYVFAINGYLSKSGTPIASGESHNFILWVMDSTSSCVVYQESQTYTFTTTGYYSVQLGGSNSSQTAVGSNSYSVNKLFEPGVTLNGLTGTSLPTLSGSCSIATNAANWAVSISVDSTMMSGYVPLTATPYALSALKAASSPTGGFNIYNGSSNITLSAPAGTSSYTFSLPNAAAPGNGYVLMSNATGGTSWQLLTGGGTITSVNTGTASTTGLSGGATTGAANLQVNMGTSANQVVQLDGSAKLPAVDGSALTNLTATNILTGILPIARGGTGLSLSNPTSGTVMMGTGTGLTMANLNCSGTVSCSNTSSTINIVGSASGGTTAAQGTSPGFNFAGDTTTGLSDSGGTLSLVVGGTSVLSATSSVVSTPLGLTTGSFSTSGNAVFNGNVGIGSSTPVALLDVNGNTAAVAAAPGISLIAGSTTQTSGSAGSVSIKGGNANVSGGAGGTVTIGAGNANGGSTGGSVNLSAGGSSGGGTPGSISLTSGYNAGTGTGGALALTAGGSMSNTGGTVTIQGGAGSTRGPVVIQPTSGNVGIGSTSPAYTLDVAGDVNVTGAFRVNGTTLSGGSSQWTTNSSNIYYSTGNVGVGTTTPSSTLHVNGEIRSDSGLFVTAINSNTGPQISLMGGGGNYGQIFYNSSPNSYSLGYGPNRTNAGTAALSWNTSGKVGIGTTNPAYALDVSGDVNVTGAFKVNGVALSGGSSQWTTNSSNIYYSTGNVGIGTVSANYPLDVWTSGTYGVSGQTSNGTAGSSGVYGYSSTSGPIQTYGVQGVANPSNGNGYGVYGNGSTGVYGTGTVHGVGGGTASASGAAIWGYSTGSTGVNYGVYGFDQSPAGYGVYGTNAGGGVGGYFSSTTGNALITGSGNVGIGTTSPGAALDIYSTTSGVLLPRLTTAQRTAISSPAAGLEVYDSTAGQLYYYNGSSWQALGVTGGILPVANGGTGTASGSITGTGALSFTASGANDLNLQSSNTTSTAINLSVTGTNGGITLSPNGTGVVTVGGSTPKITSAGSLSLMSASGGYTTLIGNPNSGSSTTISAGTGGAISLNGNTNLSANSTFTMASGTGTFTQNYSGTGAGFTINSTGTGTGLTINASTGPALKIVDGTQGASKVLTSDSSGNASWQTVSASPSGTAGGDLSGTYPNPTVNIVGTSTASNIHSAELLANAATNVNTVNTIVKRDSSGNFSAGTVTVANGVTFPDGVQQISVRQPNSNSLGIGYGSGTSVTGGGNILIGYNAGSNVNSGAINTALGYQTLASDTSGGNNAAIGSGALYSVTTGSSNTALGYGAGYNASTNSSSNIFIGNNAGPSSSTAVNNSLWINNSAGTPLIYGDFSTGRLGIGTTAPTVTLDLSTKTDAIRLPAGTTAQEPTGSAGMIRYNTTNNTVEFYNGSAWTTLAASGGGTTLNSIAAASAAGSIDNTSYTQNWNWSTLTTGQGLNVSTGSSNSLTTGSLVTVTTSSSNTAFSSTNGLLYVANLSSSTSGAVAKIQSNSTSGSGLTVAASGNVGVGTSSPGSALQVAGPIATAVTTVSSATYTALATDSVLLANAASLNIAITLPTISSAMTGRQMMIKRIDNSMTYNLTISGGGGNTIDGNSSFKLGPYSWAQLVNDGTSWYVLASSGRLSCPTGYSLVGNAGSADAYCITTSIEATAVSFNGAVTNCKTKGMHLCGTVEWMNACNFLGTTAMNVTATNTEYVDQIYIYTNAQVLLVAGAVSCNFPTSPTYLGVTSSTGSTGYRCCTR